MTAVQTIVVLREDFSHEVKVDSTHEVEKGFSQEIMAEVFRVGVSLICPIQMRGGTRNHSEKRGR